MECAQISKLMNGWKKFGMKIIKLEMVDEYLYHLDCSIFPLTKEKTLVCTELYIR
jgi:N-dimethylarginine dimethylaminohydrolase